MDGAADLIVIYHPERCSCLSGTVEGSPDVGYAPFITGFSTTWNSFTAVRWREDSSPEKASGLVWQIWMAQNPVYYSPSSDRRKAVTGTAFLFQTGHRPDG